MNNYDIPIIEPTVDYTKIPPINQKRTISFINHFIIHTVTYLNKFALTCEEKLFEFENKLQRIESSLELLESRLSSIQGLEQATQYNIENVDANTAQNVKQNVEEQEIRNEENEPIEKESETQQTQTDPRLEKFLKMLHFGVPKGAVKLKMEQAGLDPSLIE